MVIILWTDLLFFLVLVSLIFGVIQTLRHEHLRRPWRKVLHHRSAMVSLVIILAYLFVAIMDSIHFRPTLKSASGERRETEIISVMDSWLTPQRTRVEKTYSAPFALYSHAKEMVRLPDGSQIWDYPRLKYGGAHLTDPRQNRMSDIVRICIKGLCYGALLWFIPSAI